MVLSELEKEIIVEAVANDLVKMVLLRNKCSYEIGSVAREQLERKIAAANTVLSKIG